jgi:hypothetical protein
MVLASAQVTNARVKEIIKERLNTRISKSFFFIVSLLYYVLDEELLKLEDCSPSNCDNPLLSL